MPLKTQKSSKISPAATRPFPGKEKGDTLTDAAVTKGAKDLFKQFLPLLAPYDGKFKNMDAMVMLFKGKADASTLVHEIAHYAFET